MVVSRMIEDGHISNDEAEKLIDEVKNYKFYENKTTILSPHFVFWVKEQLTEKYGEETIMKEVV
jgi:membrane carboxypeptidase/penicillin-binding protein